MKIIKNDFYVPSMTRRSVFLRLNVFTALKKGA